MSDLPEQTCSECGESGHVYCFDMQDTTEAVCELGVLMPPGLS